LRDRRAILAMRKILVIGRNKVLSKTSDNDVLLEKNKWFTNTACFRLPLIPFWLIELSGISDYYGIVWKRDLVYIFKK
jgi:hypothetical protein